MDRLLAQLFPLAIGTLLSPLAIMAIIAVLLSERPRANGIAFSAGWTLAVAGILVITIAIASSLTIHRPSSPPSWVAILHLLIGVVLVASAIWAYARGRARLQAMAQASRPHDIVAAAPQLPGWLKSVEHFRPMRCAVLGFALCAFNPVDLSCVIGASLALRVSDAGTAADVVAGILFVIVGALPAAAPLGIYLARGADATGPLQAMRSWIAGHNGMLTNGLLLVVGVLQLIKGFTQF